MIENVDRYEVELADGRVMLRFTDLFGVGTEYILEPEDALQVRDAISAVLADTPKRP